MENAAVVSTTEQAPPKSEDAESAALSGGSVQAPAVEAASEATKANPAEAVELLFKVANVTAAALAYEASCGNTPTAATCDASAKKAQSKPHQTSNALQTPQKLTGSKSNGNWNCNESLISADDSTLLDDDDNDGFVVNTPCPSTAWPGARSGKGNGRRAWARHEDNESRSAIARRALPRAAAPQLREARPPAPPPQGSLKALPAEHVQKFLRLVQDGDYNEALRALRKVRRAVKGRGCSKEAFGGMRALLHHLLEGYACSSRLPEALELLENMKNGTEARLVSAAAFNAMLRGLLARGAIDEARFVVREEMPRLAVAPNEASLNTLMDTAARAGPMHLEEAWDVLEEMQNRGLQADKYTVSILTKGITDRGDNRQRRGVPRGVLLVEHFLRSQPDDVDEVLVNSLLDVFCRMGDMPRLEATLVKMREYGIRGSAVTYGTIVKAYGKSGNIDKVVQAWEDMSTLGLEANAVTYGCMLDACVKCGHLEKALMVFNTMKERNLHRNTILYATLIKGFAKSKDPMAARDLHTEMVREGVTCNVVVFNSLIDACVRANDLAAAAKVLTQMQEAGVKPDLITFSTLIKGYCSNGEMDKAMQLSEELGKRHLQCDEIVYNSLLEGCVKAGDLQLGLKLFTSMRQQHIQPSSVTFSILVKLLSRAGRLDLACHLVAQEMKEMHGVVPTRMVWSCLVTCCVKGRDLSRAVVVLESLDRDGGAVGSARTSMYASVIEGCLQQGEVGIALVLCERAYSRVPPEEGVRGILSADLLRRVFEAVGRGPEAEARGLLESISSRLSEQVRSSLEDALNRGAKKQSPKAGESGRNYCSSAPRVGVSEASNMGSLGADALLNSSSGANAYGGVVAAAQTWPSYQGQEALMNNMGWPMWDQSGNAAAMGAQAAQWAWPGGMPMPGMPMPGMPMPGMPGMPPMPGVQMPDGSTFYDQSYGAGWQVPWPQTWDEGAAWAAAAAAAAPLPMPAELGLTATVPPAAQTMAATPEVAIAETPVKCAETPSTASGDGKKSVERTPATTAGRSSEAQSPVPEDDELTPVNMRLFAPGSATDTGKCGGAIVEPPMRVEVPLSALLEGPPGLN